MLYGEKLTSHTKVHSTEIIYTSRRDKLLRLTANMNCNHIPHGAENNLTPDSNTTLIDVQLEVSCVSHNHMYRTVCKSQAEVVTSLPYLLQFCFRQVSNTM